MMAVPVDDIEAERMLKLWGLSNRIGGPKGYPKIAPFVPQAHGRDLEWVDHTIELVGHIVQQLNDQDRLIVKLYYQPRSNGKLLTKNAIRKKTGIHQDIIKSAIDRCVGRVAQALSMPQYFRIENKA